MKALKKYWRTLSAEEKIYLDPRVLPSFPKFYQIAEKNMFDIFTKVAVSIASKTIFILWDKLALSGKSDISIMYKDIKEEEGWLLFTLIISNISDEIIQIKDVKPIKGELEFEYKILDITKSKAAEEELSTYTIRYSEYSERIPEEYTNYLESNAEFRISARYKGKKGKLTIKYVQTSALRKQKVSKKRLPI